jgi:hypothetical protein
MNTRFFLNFLTAPKRNAGFAMPMVIMAGLVITVAAAAIAMKGMNDQNQVTAKAMKQQSEAVAEAGVVQIQNFLLGSKFMAFYPSSKWGTAITVNADGTVTINDTDVQKYVTRVATALASGGGGACAPGTPPTSAEITAKEAVVKSVLKNLVTANSLTGKDLVSGDPSKGKFRLTKFDYQGYVSDLSNPANDKTYYPPAGTSWLAQMTVEGQIPGQDTKTTITTTIPVSVTPELDPLTFTGITPGLWVKEGGVNDASKPETSYDDSAGTINGDIAISDCGGNISNTYMSQLHAAQQSRGYQAYRTDAPMPSIPSIPTTPYTLSGSASLPRAGEVPAADGYYYYSSPSNLGDITLDHGSDGSRKFRIYLYGDIPKTTSVNSNCKTKAGCIPTNLQIFGMKSSGGEICMNGNSDRAVDAFVLAPNYALGKTGNGNFYGTFIVKSFGKIGSCGSNNGKLAIVSTQPSNTVPNEFIGSSAYPTPEIGAITTWQSLETESVGTVPALSLPPGDLGGRIVSQAPLVSSASSASSVASSVASSISSQVSSAVSSTTSSVSSQVSSAVSSTTSSVSSIPILSSITNRLACIAAGGKWNSGQGGRCS